MNIFQIFIDDIKGLVKNPIAIVVIIGVAALPLLYAWFNIIANWDPYGSTGNILFAVVNEDKGADFEGLELNLGSQVELETIDVFPVENYGSAMTPFYSVLVIWVEALFLWQ